MGWLNSCEPEVEVVLSVIVSCIILRIHRCGIEATAYAHSADTIRYDNSLSELLTNCGSRALRSPCRRPVVSSAHRVTVLAT